MSENLTRCPFCGAKAQLEYGVNRFYPVWTVKCKGSQCGAEISFGEHFKNWAIEAWNKRANNEADVETRISPGGN